ncbi:hypothetical protein AARAC_011319, partial [Aspergillus arachidicola]
MSTHSRWVVLALASGAFAALNGLFAKLTTDTQTTTFSKSLLAFLSLTGDHPILEMLIRG